MAQHLRDLDEEELSDRALIIKVYDTVLDVKESLGRITSEHGILSHRLRAVEKWRGTAEEEVDAVAEMRQAVAMWRRRAIMGLLGIVATLITAYIASKLGIRP